MLAMIKSVPEDEREDVRFERALCLVAHLSACRENWLDRMSGDGKHQVDWWPKQVALASLKPRLAVVEADWTEYLGRLTDEDLDEDFEFTSSDGRRFRWNVEGQIVQLVGHAFYHRGQVALLVSEMGGIPFDTDYLYWEYERNPKYGVITDQAN